MALSHEQREWLSVQAVPCTAILSVLLAASCTENLVCDLLFRILMFLCLWVFWL